MRGSTALKGSSISRISGLLANAEVLAPRIERGTAPGGGRETPEAQHRVIPLLHRAVVLFREVVEVWIRPVHDLPAQDPADRAAVRRMLVRGDALRLALGHLDESPEEAPGGVRVPVLAAHGVEEHPLAVDGAVERAPAARDLHGGLIDAPGDAGAAAPLRSQLVREQRGEADLPGADRLVRDLEAALEEQLSDVAAAQLGAETPEHGEQHDVRWVLPIGEGRAGPLVEPPPAGPAAEPPGAERGAALAPRRHRECTVWTRQQRPLTVPWMRRAEAGVP